MTSIDTKRANNGNISVMAKRTFIQIECSEEYKAELQRLIGRYMPMSAEVRRLLEKQYPTLRKLAEKEGKS